MTVDEIFDEFARRSRIVEIDDVKRAFGRRAKQFSEDHHRYATLDQRREILGGHLEWGGNDAIDACTQHGADAP